MSPLNFTLLLATFIWSCLFDRRLLFIYLGILIIYMLFTIIPGRNALTSFRRKMQIATWNDTGDPSLFVSHEIQISNLMEFVKNFNCNNPDSKISLTLLFAKIFGKVFEENPKINGCLSFGEFLPQKDVNMLIAVDIEGKNLGFVVLEGCNHKSLKELSEEYRLKVKKLKKKECEKFNNQIKLVGWMPAFLMQLLTKVSSWISYDLGISIPFLHIKKHNFGYGMITNIMPFEMNDVHAPLVPFLKAAYIIVMNASRKIPIVENDQIVIREVMKLNYTVDHRFVDGSDVVGIKASFDRILNNLSELI